MFDHFAGNLVNVGASMLVVRHWCFIGVNMNTVRFKEPLLLVEEELPRQTLNKE